MILIHDSSTRVNVNIHVHEASFDSHMPVPMPMTPLLAVSNHRPSLPETLNDIDAYKNDLHSDSVDRLISASLISNDREEEGKQLISRESDQKEASLMDSEINNKFRIKRKFSHFENLFNIMVKFLLNKPISNEDLNLSYAEIQLFGCFLVKKYRGRSPEILKILQNGQIKLSPGEIPAICLEINRNSYLKRKEENLKLVFNWAFDSFFEKIQHERSLDRVQAEEFFYQHYFLETSKKYSIDIVKFYKPDFSRCSSDRLKTYNSTYIRNVKLSSSFSNDLVNILNVHFLISMTDIIIEKVFIQCKKWEHRLKADCFSERSVNKLCESVIRNKKVKMAWSLLEAENAKQMVLRSLNKP
jgi:hypothetical protein